MVFEGDGAILKVSGKAQSSSGTLRKISSKGAGKVQDVSGYKGSQILGYKVLAQEKDNKTDDGYQSALFGGMEPLAPARTLRGICTWLNMFRCELAHFQNVLPNLNAVLGAPSEDATTSSHRDQQEPLPRDEIE